jgi:hypothetical protein
MTLADVLAANSKLAVPDARNEAFHAKPQLLLILPPKSA